MAASDGDWPKREMASEGSETHTPETTDICMESGGRLQAASSLLEGGSSI